MNMSFPVYLRFAARQLRERIIPALRLTRIDPAKALGDE
jgi:hypothetical protein